MRIKFAENSYLDADKIQFINGRYETKDPMKWKTSLVIDGVPFDVDGQPGKNIMDAYYWMHRHSIYNFSVPEDSPKHKQLLKNGER